VAPLISARPARSERGIALIVTLILLSVITFLAVAFLFLARRERGAVANTVEQSVARLAAEAAVERARAELLAQMLGTTNRFAYDLRVSTNFINPPGFIPGNTFLTNVNYDYANGAPVAGNDFLQNLANLYYSPRPPVFVRTNRTQANAPLDFRFWLDLNRNGVFDTNGPLPEFDRLGNFVLITDTNGNLVPVTNNFVGDPEWIGILDRTDRPHGPNNRFVSRFAWIAVPSGKTLDLNAIHNQAKQNGPLQDGFRRNMGFGTWELNLAAFLTDLNTNLWNPPGGQYLYNPNPGLSTGVAFQNAADLVSYRYGRNFNTLRSVQALFGAPGTTAFINDFVDGYGVGPLMTGRDRPLTDPDLGLTLRPWSGAPNTNHFTSLHDLFDPAKTSVDFTNRLSVAGRLPASYDRYTFYRLLSQLGTDTGPEQPTNKLHLNYVNVSAAGVTVPDAQTNFLAWEPLQFFTNAVDRLLRANFPDPALNRILFNVNAPLALTNLPVLVSNQFVYSPVLHRLMQVAANVTDVSARPASLKTPQTDHIPLVFRPVFARRNVDGRSDIYIAGFALAGPNGEGRWDVVSSFPLRDLNVPGVADAVEPNDRILGVPLVVGARKGLPNFNEYALYSASQLIRKVALRRPSTNANVLPNQTNQLFIVGVSNAFGFEAWNSYQNAFGVGVDIYVTNFFTASLRHTNDVLQPDRWNFRLMNFALGNRFTTNVWPGVSPGIETPVPGNFILPLQTNFVFVTNSLLRMPASGQPFLEPNLNIMNGGPFTANGFGPAGVFHIPEIHLALQHRILFAIVDRSGNILDYVHLAYNEGDINLINQLSRTDKNTAADVKFWDRARLGGNTLGALPQGVNNQIFESLGAPVGPAATWVNFAGFPSKDHAIQTFRKFCGQSALSALVDNRVLTALEMQAPYTPSGRIERKIRLQANDPLVHYMVDDLISPALGDGITIKKINDPVVFFDNLGKLNDRYEPWSKDRGFANTRMNVALKDPNVRRSDDWDFPTNAYPSVGWLGRVHRGTPWQTIYMKSADVTPQVWTNYTGHTRQRQGIPEATFSRPIYDRLLFDVFTAAVNEDATRGQLNVNQDGLAAWSALLSGVIGLTNTATDAQLNLSLNFRTNFIAPFRIEPAGVDVDPTNSIVHRIWAGIQRTRGDTNTFNGTFRRAADVLATPELTLESPLLNRSSAFQLERGIDDATYERLPQMLMGLLRGNETPRFTIYAWGQALKPADRSIVTTGPFRGLCANYQVTAEFATRTVVRIEGAPRQPRAVVESFNILPPD